MGYRKIPKIYTLEFDGDLEGLIVRVRSIKFGKIRRIISLTESDDKDVELMDEISTELTSAIVSWNMLDEDDQETEVTKEAVDDLEFDEVMAIVNKWLDCMTGPSKELGKDSGSGATFPGQPLTMEAL